MSSSTRNRVLGIIVLLVGLAGLWVPWKFSGTTAAIVSFPGRSLSGRRKRPRGDEGILLELRTVVGVLASIPAGLVLRMDTH